MNSALSSRPPRKQPRLIKHVCCSPDAKKENTPPLPPPIPGRGEGGGGDAALLSQPCLQVSGGCSSISRVGRTPFAPSTSSRSPDSADVGVCTLFRRVGGPLLGPWGLAQRRALRVAFVGSATLLVACRSLGTGFGVSQVVPRCMLVDPHTLSGASVSCGGMSCWVPGGEGGLRPSKKARDASCHRGGWAL